MDLYTAEDARILKDALCSKFGSEIGSILTLLMHKDEDNDIDNQSSLQENILVNNESFITIHMESIALSHLQAAENDIYHESLTKAPIPASEPDTKNIVPQPGVKNHPPLFKVDNNHLLCRIPFAGQPLEQYETLTHAKAYELLTHYAEIAIDKTLVEKIKSCMLTLKSDIDKTNEEAKLLKQQKLDEYVYSNSFSIFKESDLVYKKRSSLFYTGIFEFAVDDEDENRSCPTCHLF